MGVNSIFSTYVPRYKNKGEIGECSYLCRSVICIRILVVVLAIVILIFCTDPIVAFIGEPAIEEFLILTCVWFFIRGVMDCFLYILWADMHMKYFSAVQISVSLVQLAGVVGLLYHGMTVRALIMFMIGINLLQTTCYVWGCLPTIRVRPKKTGLIPILKFGITVGFAEILHYFRDKSIDIIMILYFLKDPESVAYYDIAYLIALYGGTLLLVSLDRLTLPILSEA